MSLTRGRITNWIAGLTVSVIGVSAFAQRIDRETIDRTLDEQQRAQVQTADLLASVLHVQLRQLEENGLTEHEIYRDVQLMRRNLQNLVASDMQRIVDTLRKARQLPPAQRDEAFKEARLQIRQVVRQLTVERQLLLQRLKIFDLADQVRKLIQQQAMVQSSTAQLIRRDTSSDQGAQTLKAIEDQRDIHELYRHLIETLHDMKTRRGPNAVIAADGLRILTVLELDRQVDSASRLLQAIQLESANEAQTFVVNGLKELLRLIGRAQGTIDTENATAREIVRALIERQKQLRDQTKLLTSPQAPPAELVEQQVQLQGGISRLHEHVATHAKADAYRQQADAAVFDAASNLLENKLPQAITDQGRVLGSLAALERAVSDDAPYLSRDQSADDLSQTVRILTNVQKELADAIEKNDVSGTEASSSEFARIVRELRVLIQPQDEQNPWPDFVRVALTEVTDALSSKAADSGGLPPTDHIEPSDGNPTRTESLSAVKQAKATIDRTLIEARRISLAIRIGELTRSAEVLERTAAEQRSIVKDTVGLMDGGRTAMVEGIERAKELSARQNHVAEVADRIATALARMTPDLAKSVANNASRARTLNGGDVLTMAITSPDGVQKSLETATSIAQHLASSAQDLREQIVLTADELTLLSTEQAARLSELRTAVETAVDQMPTQDLPNQLEQVRLDLDRAIQEQLRAQGHHRAADAMSVASAIQEVLNTQEIADVVLDVNSSIENTDLKATTVQAEVAEKARAVAAAVRAMLKAAPTKEHERVTQLLTSIDEVEQSATNAAKQTLARDATAAKESRARIQTTLKAAMSLAQQNVAQAMSDELRNPPNKQAQAEVTKVVTVAQQRLTAIPGETSEKLTAAFQAMADATTALSNDTLHSAEEQAKALTELVQTRDVLNQTIQQMVVTQSQQMAQQSAQNLDVAKRVEVVEPSASAAIREAIAKVGRDTKSDLSARHIAAEIGRVTLGLEQAVAELGAREQEVRHDLAIAESVSASIKRQQAATTTITEQALELERMAMASRQEVSATAQRAAAHKLNEARRRFVDAQRATGQAAVELSGQIEIANPPLREALELAAKFVGTEQGINSPENTDEMREASAENDNPFGTPQQQDAEASQVADANGSKAGEKTGSERREGSNARGAPAGKNPNGLGTGFISQSPDLTAEMMAGADAIHAARQALTAQLPPSQQSDADSKAPPGDSNDTEQNESQLSESGRSSKLAKGNNASGVNQKVKDGMIDQQPEGTEAKGQASGESRQTDENVNTKALKEDAWFAKLPPELRNSLRAGIGQKGPRTYEERLKKYFQSVD
ncbi:hypothetical protein [Schlesneria paludicola]|uniref:hypothetical protein n=1 Tax=Schlesneria paludicola TaxID=360056 RepID=UPI00029A101A|nr:hypothetical protein [Schlesneria paludicola]